jgi:hypothetical protein
VVVTVNLLLFYCSRFAVDIVVEVDVVVVVVIVDPLLLSFLFYC